jgi:Zn-dependent protease with chaperone function
VLPDLSFLVALALGLILYTAAPTDAAPTLVFALGGTATVLLVTGALCRLAADRAIRGLEETDAAAVVSSSGRIVLLPMLGWLATVWAFDWPVFVRTAVPQTWFLVPYLVLFAPLLGLFAAGWIAARRVEAKLSPDAPSRGGAVLRGLRRNLLVIVPLLVLLGLMDLLRVLAAAKVPAALTLEAWIEAYPHARDAATLVVFLGFGLLAPTLFRVALRAKPLEDGPLRRDLEEMARRIGLGVRGFLLWDTKGRAINAMVVGLTARTRYVFLTDGLIDALPRAEVTAVVAHEAGHGMRHHLPLYFVTAFALVLLQHAATDLGAAVFGRDVEFYVLGAFLFVFWFGVLGWLSRRFEREADVYGAEHAAVLLPDAPPLEVTGAPAPLPHGTALMISVLRRLDRAVPGGRHHRHAHPRDRVAYLAAHAADPAVREAHRRDARNIRLVLFGVLLAALALTAAGLPAATARGDARMTRLEGVRAYDRALDARKAGDDVAAQREIRVARDRFAEAARRLETRPDDVEMKKIALVSLFNQADVELRWLSDERAAKDLFGRALALLDSLSGVEAGRLVFDANVDLGRIALHQAAATSDGVRAAERHYTIAENVPESRYGGDLRAERLRLLRSAIDLRNDAAKDVAARARADLREQTRNKLSGEEWDELRKDAQAELDAAPTR